MSDGSTGNLEYTNKKEIKMAKQEQIAKISVYQENYTYAHGFRFFNSKNEVVLEVGENFNHPRTDFELANGERVLGLKSRMNCKDKNACHCDV